MERPACRLYEGSAGFPAAVGTQCFQRLMEERVGHTQPPGRVHSAQAGEAQVRAGGGPGDLLALGCVGDACLEEKGHLDWAVEILGWEGGMAFLTEAEQNERKPRNWNSSSKGRM